MSNISAILWAHIIEMMREGNKDGEVSEPKRTESAA